LSANFGYLAREVQAAADAGADWIHVDVMDGQFVPNISIGPLVVRAVRAATNLPVDVHLMIADPDQFLEEFAEAGADVITVHAEACRHLQRTLRRIRDLDVASGVALNPHTPESVVKYVIDDLDLVLVMTVNPGFGGQAFLPAVLPKVSAVGRMLGVARRAALIEVDGGVGPATAGAVAGAGAGVLVAGSAVFSKPDYGRAIASIRRAASSALSGEPPA
jgi:ribulose-phosphate 3-epimerase